jgi:hypothetical protein
VTLESKTARHADGQLMRTDVDHVFADDAGGTLFGVESKNGLRARSSRGQRQVYPEMGNTGVTVHGNELAGEGFPDGSTLHGDVHTDHWYSPPDATSLGTHAAVQTGAQGVKAAGSEPVTTTSS